jgi:hypothetical protein
MKARVEERDLASLQKWRKTSENREIKEKYINIHNGSCELCDSPDSVTRPQASSPELLLATIEHGCCLGGPHHHQFDSRTACGGRSRQHCCSGRAAREISFAFAIRTGPRVLPLRPRVGGLADQARYACPSPSFPHPSRPSAAQPNSFALCGGGGDVKVRTGARGGSDGSACARPQGSCTTSSSCTYVAFHPLLVPPLHA